MKQEPKTLKELWDEKPSGEESLKVYRYGYPDNFYMIGKHKQKGESNDNCRKDSR